MKRARGSMGESEVETWTRMLSFSLRTSPLRNHSRVEHHFHSGNFSFVSLLDRALVDYASKLSALEVVKTSSLRASYKIHVPPLAFTAIDPRERNPIYIAPSLSFSARRFGYIYTVFKNIVDILPPFDCIFPYLFSNQVIGSVP